MLQKTLIVIEGYNGYEYPEVFESDMLKTPHSVLKSLAEIKQNPNIISEFKTILDCTQNYMICGFIKNSGGIDIKDEYSYIKNMEQIFVYGIPVQHFIVRKEEEPFLNPVVTENKKNTLTEFKKRVKFLEKFLTVDTTVENMQTALSMGMEIHAEGKIKYVLVDEIPKNKEQNVEYVVASNIPFLKDVMNIVQHIKPEK